MRLIGGVLLLAAVLASVACGGDKGVEAAATVTVTQPADGAASPAPDATDSGEAKVRVTKSGFAYESQFGTVGYGLVLKNDSGQDATDVQIAVNIVDSKGLILTTDNAQLTGIPAHGTFYFGNSTLAENGRPARLEVEVTNSSEPATGVALPKVSNARISDSGYGFVSAVGQVRNDYTQRLSDFASIGVVAFDSAGKVVTGSQTFLQAPLRPGRSASFDTSLTGISSGSEVARVEASVENEVR